MVAHSTLSRQQSIGQLAIVNEGVEIDQMGQVACWWARLGLGEALTHAEAQECW